LRRSCRLLEVVVVYGSTTGGWCRASCTGFGPRCRGLVTIDAWNPENDEVDRPVAEVGKWLYGGVGRVG
jgi:hypothetical protein